MKKTEEQNERSRKDLADMVELRLPTFAAACRHAIATGTKEMLFTTEAFEGDREYEGYILLGMAVKYASSLGLDVHIVSHDTPKGLSGGSGKSSN